ncbi:hypothetical protein [Nocardia sp. NPDC059239]|uniref:hypothetical protein n=1 Tax=Nocardia sp. NPDC059239 TaxID=3346785 RepID=UPI0036B934D0
MDEHEVRALLPADRPVTVLHDPADDVAVTHGLLAAHDPAAGVVVVHPTPGSHAGQVLAVDILNALGRSVARLSAERINGPDAIWHAVAAWVDAECVDHLIVLRAHRLRDEQRMRLLQLRWLTGVRLVLVWHTRTVHADRDLDLVGLPHEVTTDLAGLLGELAAQPRLPDEPNPADDRDLPAVPHSDFDKFRADAARTLDPAAFGRIDAVYTAALHEVCRYLADREWADPDDHGHPYTEVWSGRARPVLAKARGHDIDPALFSGEPEDDDAYRYPLQVMLAALVADSPGLRCTITRVRGAQAALQLHGWRLELPNLAFSVGPGLTSTPLTTAVVDRIRARVPSAPRAAALATALFTGATPGELAMLYLDHLSPAATHLTTGHRGRIYAVPPIARPLLRAAHTQITLNNPARRGLLIGGTGPKGRTLRISADVCGIRLPACHRYANTWIANITVAADQPRPDRDLLYALQLTDTPARTARSRSA